MHARKVSRDLANMEKETASPLLNSNPQARSFSVAQSGRSLHTKLLLALSMVPVFIFGMYLYAQVGRDSTCWPDCTSERSFIATNPGPCACAVNGRPVDESKCQLPSSTRLQLHQPPHPDIEGWQAEPCTLLNATRAVAGIQDPTLPVFSVLVTVHNTEHFINSSMTGIMKQTSEAWELIVIFDGCTDSSADHVRLTLEDHLREQKPMDGKLVRVVLLNQATSIFETSANNLAMRIARGKYFIIIQEDKVPDVAGWNSLLTSPIRRWDDVAIVSGVCGGNQYSTQVPDRQGDGCHWPPYKHDLNWCEYRIRDVAPRGPWAMRAEMVRALNYFDEEHFWLGSDDHDMAARAYIQHGWKIGVYVIPWINFDYNGAHFGGNSHIKHNRSIEEDAWIAARQQRGRDTPSFLSHAYTLNPKNHDENRTMTDVGCNDSGNTEWFRALASLDK